MFAKKILELLSKREYRRFIESLKNPKEVQATLRNQLFTVFLKSDYGIDVGPKNWEEIPIVNYQDIAPWIASKKLTATPVTHYVETSGSSSTSKKIPYTKDLLKSFNNMFKIWAYDLLKNVLKGDIGKIFMSLTPPGSTGLKDDSEYLNPLLKMLLKPYLILPPLSHENFQENLAKILLFEKNIGIISIWNPTYLLQVLDYVDGKEELLPRLQFISCWTDGWSKSQAEVLKNRFPKAVLQGKGLLATEVPMTVPLFHAPAPVPLINEVYFEFEEPSGEVLTIDKVRMGEIYELIISQKGGLTRYRIGDRVQVTGSYLNCPCLSFIGRSGKVCDMVGEKLDSILVEEVLREVFKPSLLLPVYSTHKPYYMLLTESENDLSESMESQLSEIYHYRIARYTGQLGPVKICKISGLLTKLHRFYADSGMNPGDIKDTVFMHDPSQAAKFISFCQMS